MLQKQTEKVSFWILKLQNAELKKKIMKIKPTVHVQVKQKSNTGLPEESPEMESG